MPSTHFLVFQELRKCWLLHNLRVGINPYVLFQILQLLLIRIIPIHLLLLLLFFFVRVLLLQKGVLDGWIMHTEGDLVQIWLLALK